MKEEREPKLDPAVNCTDMAAFLLLHRLGEAPVRLQSFRGYAGLWQVRALHPEPTALPCDQGNLSSLQRQGNMKVSLSIERAFES